MLEFDSSRPSVRLHYLNSFQASTRWSGRSAHTGKFVGASRDGPLGVIGTWELGASNQSVFPSREHMLPTWCLDLWVPEIISRDFRNLAMHLTPQPPPPYVVVRVIRFVAR